MKERLGVRKETARRSWCIVGMVSPDQNYFCNIETLPSLSQVSELNISTVLVLP
jgi:hypothetical protein